MSTPVDCESVEGPHLISIVINLPIGGDIVIGQRPVALKLVRLILSAAEKKLGFFGSHPRDVMPKIAQDLDGFEPAIADFGGRDIDVGETAKAQASHENHGGHKENCDKAKLCRSRAAKRQKR